MYWNKLLLISIMLFSIGFSESFFITNIGENAVIYNSATNISTNLSFKADSIVKSFDGSYVMTNSTTNDVKRVYANGTTIQSLTLSDNIASCNYFNNEYYCTTEKTQTGSGSGSLTNTIKIYDTAGVLQDTKTYTSSATYSLGATTAILKVTPTPIKLDVNNVYLSYNWELYKSTGSGATFNIANMPMIEKYDYTGTSQDYSTDTYSQTSTGNTGYTQRNLITTNGDNFIVSTYSVAQGITTTDYTTNNYYETNAYNQQKILNSSLDTIGTYNKNTRGTAQGSDGLYYYVDNANQSKLTDTSGSINSFINQTANKTQGIINTQTYYSSSATQSDMTFYSNKYSAECGSMGGIAGVQVLTTDSNNVTKSCVTVLESVATETTSLSPLAMWSILNTLDKKYYTAPTDSNHIQYYEASTNSNTLASNSLNGYDEDSYTGQTYHLTNGTGNYTIAQVMPYLALDANLTDIRLKTNFFGFYSTPVLTGNEYFNITIYSPYNTTTWQSKNTYINATDYILTIGYEDNASNIISDDATLYTTSYTSVTTEDDFTTTTTTHFLQDFNHGTVAYIDNATKMLYSLRYIKVDTNTDQVANGGFTVYPTTDSYINFSYTPEANAYCTIEGIANGQVTISGTAPEASVFYDNQLNTMTDTISLTDDMPYAFEIQENGTLKLDAKILNKNTNIVNAFCELKQVGTDNKQVTISNANGICSFNQLHTNTHYLLKVNPNTPKYNVVTQDFVTGDYYNTQLVGTYAQYKCNNFDGTIKYNIDVSKQGLDTDHIVFYVRDISTNNLIYNAIVTIDNDTSLSCNTNQNNGSCNVYMQPDYTLHNVTVTNGYYTDYNALIELNKINTINMIRRSDITVSNPETAGIIGKQASEDQLSDILDMSLSNIGISIIAVGLAIVLGFSVAGLIGAMGISMLTAIFFLYLGWLPSSTIFLLAGIIAVALMYNQMSSGA